MSVSDISDPESDDRTDVNKDARGRSTAVLWLIFVIAAFGFSRIPGINEPHYLAKARAFADPEWCTKDFFLQSANAHYVFYLIAGPLTQFLSLTMVAVVGRLLSLLIFAIGWNRLGRSLGISSNGTMFAAVAFLCFSQAGNFSGEWILGGFEAKVPAFGFVLISLSHLAELSGKNQSLQSRAFPVAGFWLGAATAWHPVVGGWALMAASAAFFIATRATTAVRIKRVVILNGAAIVTALPGLVPAVLFLLGQDVDKADADLANFYQVFWRLRHHLDPMEIPRSGWNWLAALSVLLVVLWLSSRWMKRHMLVQTPNGARRFVGLVLLMSLIIAVIGVVIGWHSVPATEMKDWQWRATLLKFYPFRLLDALLPIMTALSVGVFVDELQLLAAKVSRSSRLVEETRSSRPGNERRPGRVANLAACICAGAVLVWIWSASSAVPAGYTQTQVRDWLQACEWIRKNAPADALFLTPRESFAFKWYAERAEYVCYKDCPQDARGIIEWNRRLWYLHDWTLQCSGDNLYSREELIALRAETGITHILTRILGPFEDAPLHREGEWMIIALPESP